VPRSVDDLLAEARSRYERVDAVTAAQEVADGRAILIDTRHEGYRRKKGDVPGAISITLDVLEWRLDPQSSWKIPEVADHDARIILMCREGYSSSLAVGRLLDLGLRNATDVIDGVDGWVAAGLELAPFGTTRSG
jgi:rhodanese-related sulfurtransferase